MKIQFIVCGWWYDEFDGKKGVTDFIEELNYLKNENDHIDVFYSCHKEPPKIVKDNFEDIVDSIGDWDIEESFSLHNNRDTFDIVTIIPNHIIVNISKKEVEVLFNA